MLVTPVCDLTRAGDAAFDIAIERGAAEAQGELGFGQADRLGGWGGEGNEGHDLGR